MANIATFSWLHQPDDMSSNGFFIFALMKPSKYGIIVGLLL